VTCRHSLLSLLIGLPGALLIVFGVLGCNREALSFFGYDHLIEDQRAAVESELRP